MRDQGEKIHRKSDLERGLSLGTPGVSEKQLQGTGVHERDATGLSKRTLVDREGTHGAGA